MKIGFVTGSRADRSGLEMVSAAIQRHGHKTAWRNVEPGAPRDLATDIATTAGIACGSAASWAAGHKPDIAFVAGDRSEVLGAALGLYIAGVPIAHIAGGDVTLGSADDAMRDAITALASLHFPTHQQAVGRLINVLGVSGRRVYSFGSPAVDRILTVPRVSRETAFEPLGIKLRHHAIMVSVHPETLPGAPDTCGEVLHAVREVEDALDGTLSIIVITPNNDSGFSVVDKSLQEFVAGSPATRAYVRNLAPDQYISVLMNCDAMVGNSSAGIYEAPVLGVPSVTVGARQLGRPAVAWGWAPVDRTKIEPMLLSAVLAGGCAPLLEFGDGTAAEKIAAVIDGIANPKDLLRRRP